MKKIISVLLVLCLVASIAPAYVYAFDDNANVQADNGDVTVEGTNHLGNMLVEEIEEEQDGALEIGEKSGGYTVLGLTVEGNVATVSFDTLEKAQVMVALYSEDGERLLASGKTKVSPDEHDATVTIEGDIPEYFVARAFLLDTYDFSPLCKSYTTPMYTQQMQELLESTAEDYDEDRVVTLGEDTSTNFVVYGDDTLVVRPEGEADVMTSIDEENLIYVIENASAEVQGLKAGDVIAYESGDMDILVIKVGEITAEGSKVTIVGQDVELEEVFAYMKLEQAGDAENTEQDTSCAPSDGVTFEGVESEKDERVRAIGDDISITNSLAFKLQKDIYSQGAGTVSISGEFKISLDVDLSFYISASYRFVSLKIEKRLEGNFAVSGELDYSFDLGVYAVNLFGVTIGLAPELHLTFTAKVTLSMAVTSTVGFAYDKNAGLQSLCSWPSIEAPDLSFEGTIFIGIDLCPTVRIISEQIASLDIHLPIGLELQGELYINPNYEDISDYGSTLHHCGKCVEMALYFKAVPKITLQFLNCKAFKIESELAGFMAKIEDFHYNVDTQSFGVGVCPNKSVRVTVAVENSENELVAGAPVYYEEEYFEGDKEMGDTGFGGIVVKYLTPSTYTFKTKLEGKEYKYEHIIIQAGKITLGPNVDSDRSFIAEKVDPEDYLDRGYEVDRGACGENATYVLYESGHLLIEGFGDMYEWQYDYKAPWHYSRNRITRVIIKDGVTSVGKYAFRNCKNLEMVHLGDDVSSIGYMAFADCTDLSNIQLPEKLTSIGSYAFRSCYSLEELTIPMDVTKIGNGAFQETLSLAKVDYLAKNANSTEVYIKLFDESGINGEGIELTIGKYVERIPDFLFGHPSRETGEESRVKSITFEDGCKCTKIGESAFWGIFGLEEIVLPEGLETIGENAFASAEVSRIIIPETVTSIGGRAFYAMYSLAEVNMPASLKEMGNGVFDFCYDLKKVTFNGGITTIPEYTFRECHALEEVKLSDGITAIEARAFENCTSILKIELPSTVTAIEESAFLSNTSLVSVKLSKNLLTIGKGAFKDCQSLLKVVIPDSVTSIGEEAFSGNTSLESFYLGSGVTSLNTNILNYAHSLYKLEVSPDNGTFYSKGNCIIQRSGKTVFLGCKGSVIPEDSSVKKIGSYSFAYKNGLESIVIPDNITTIMNAAFYQAGGLKTVIVKNGVTKIEASAFAYCTALENVEFGSGVSTIGSAAFRGCTSLERIELPEKVTVIDRYLLAECTALKDVSFGASVTEIDGYAFFRCSSLEAVDLNEGIVTIGDYAFYECTALGAVVVPDSVTSIGSQTFAGCTELEEIVLGSSITKIGYLAFYQDKKLGKVFFRGGAPSISTSFMGVVANAYYPEDNETWTSSKKAAYGGTLTWVAYDPESPDIGDTSYTVSAEPCAVEATETVNAQSEKAMAQVPAASTSSEKTEIFAPTPRSVFNGSQTSEPLEEKMLRTATFEGLVPGQEYFMLALISMEVDDVLAADNVLYVWQGAANEEGVLTVSYVQRVTSGLSYIMACGASYDDLSEATIEFPNMYASEEPQAIDPVVTYEGEVLTEGEDYVIVGMVDYTVQGEYTCYIRGIYDYTGLVECNYTVYEKPRDDIALEDSESFDIPAYTYGTEIAPIDLSGAVSGGTEPYTFSVEKGPLWLSFDGATLVGTRPDEKADATTATLKVTDANGYSASIEIRVGNVIKDREKIYSVQIDSDIKAPKAGLDCVSPEFTVIEGAPVAVDAEGGQWQKLTAGQWIAADGESARFSEGMWRYSLKLSIEESAGGYAYEMGSPFKVTVNGEDWSVYAEPENGPVSSLVYAVSFVYCVGGAMDGYICRIDESSNEMTVIGYAKDSSDVVIPKSFNGYTVTAIAPSAFGGRTDIVSISIPKTVQHIAPESFAGCEALERVVLNKGLIEIGENAFAGCDSLSSVTFSGTEEELSSVTVAAGNDALLSADITYLNGAVSVKIGDIDGDGRITAVDANLLKRMLAGAYMADDEEAAKLAADINGDGVVNAVDANLLRRVIAGTYIIAA